MPLVYRWTVSEWIAVTGIKYMTDSMVATPDHHLGLANDVNIYTSFW